MRSHLHCCGLVTAAAHGLCGGEAAGAVPERDGAERNADHRAGETSRCTCIYFHFRTYVYPRPGLGSGLVFGVELVIVSFDGRLFATRRDMGG